MSPDGACEGESVRIVLHEAESGPACARYSSRAVRMGGARAPGDPPPAGPAAGGPGVAGRGFISRLWGFEMTTPRPHVSMRKHCHNALHRVQYDVPHGGTRPRAGGQC